MESKIFVDANVVISILRGEENAEHLSKILMRYEVRCVSVLTCHIAHYVLKKLGKKDGEIKEFITEFFEILPMDSDTYQDSFLLSMNDDMEDAFQLSCAYQNGCGTIITLDTKMKKDYSRQFIFIEI